MPQNLTWRLSLVLLFILLSFFFLTPTLFSKLPTWWNGMLPKDKIHFGLDLQGGSHLVMEVDTQEAVRATLDLMAVDLENILNEQNIRYLRISRVGDTSVCESACNNDPL